MGLFGVAITNLPLLGKEGSVPSGWSFTFSFRLGKNPPLGGLLDRRSVGGDPWKSGISGNEIYKAARNPRPDPREDPSLFREFLPPRSAPGRLPRKLVPFPLTGKVVLLLRTTAPVGRAFWRIGIEPWDSSPPPRFPSFFWPADRPPLGHVLLLSKEGEPSPSPEL